MERADTVAPDEADEIADGSNPIHVLLCGALVETAPSVTTTLFPTTATTPPCRGAGNGVSVVHVSVAGLYSTTLLVEPKLSVCPPANTMRPLWANVPASMWLLANGMLAFWVQAFVAGSYTCRSACCSCSSSCPCSPPIV